MAEDDPSSSFTVGQRVQSKIADKQGNVQIGTVKYVGKVEGYEGVWIGVDWDSGQARHNGTVNGVHYFDTSGEKSGSFVRPQNLSAGTSLLDALESRYKTTMTKDDAEEMYLMSVRQRKVTVELVGQSKVEEKQKRLGELRAASLVLAGVSSAGPLGELSSSIPNMEELDLAGNLISDWNFVTRLCEELSLLRALDLSSNRFTIQTGPFPQISLRTLVLNNCCLAWEQLEVLKESLPTVEELHLRQNKIRLIESPVEGFERLRLLNMEDNSIDSWEQVMKLSNLRSLKHLNLSGNSMKNIYYPEHLKVDDAEDTIQKPFEQLSCLLLGRNKITEWESVDALERFPSLTDVRLTENPIADTTKGGAPRYILVARLSKITILNGSEIKPRERKESEIRYVRHVFSTMASSSSEEIHKIHPRFEQLKKLYDIPEDSALPGGGPAPPQNMAASLLAITIKCVAASVGEVAPVTKRLPGSITVGKLKLLCEGLFKLKAAKQRLFLEDKESPLPLPLDDDMESLGNLGLGQNGVILVEAVDA